MNWWTDHHRRHYRKVLEDIRSKADFYPEHIGRKIAHPNKRKFTDDQLLLAYAENPDVKALAKKMGCTTETIKQHARRLDLTYSRRIYALWTPEQDEMVRANSRGKMSLAIIIQLTGHSARTIRKRAGELGVKIVAIDNHHTKPRYSKNGEAIWSGKAPSENPITVGNDKLLLKLYKVFGGPRDEVYPGSERRVA